MHYVKQFNINGVATKQVACIELHGKPNAATEGCVGVLGVDVDSPTHDVYKCVAVNGSIYTWELLSSGMSILSATISGRGAETIQFPYVNLLTPAMYLIKVGDLVLDKEGYLYQISALDSTYCVAKYTGTQIALYGKSAYDLALDEGFEGDINEWFESLRGEQGIQGEKGEKGDTCALTLLEDGTLCVEGDDTPSVNNAFANALKGNVSGSVVAMKDASPLEHQMAVKVSSKNLIPYPYSETTRTVNGITFTDNGDGSITVNGTATAGTAFALSFGTASIPYNTSITLSGGNKQVAVVAAKKKIDGTVTNFLSTEGPPSVGQMNSGEELNIINLFVASGNTVNTTIYPQLEIGTTATPWTPYIEDISSVEVKRYGKNLIPYPYNKPTIEPYGTTFTDNGDGTITADGTATDTAAYGIECNCNLPSGTYIFSGCPAGGGTNKYLVNAAIKDFDGNWIVDTLETGNGLIVTSNNGISYIYYQMRIYSGTTVNNLVFKPMLEVGATATPYEPYVEPTTYAVDADGAVNGVSSLYPSTTLITDNRALIECEYNRDINKAFEKLTQAIISMGGEMS